MRLRKTILGCVLWLSTAGIAFAASPAAPPQQQASFNMGDCKLNTNSMDGNFKTGDFTIPGHVHLACPTRDIDADRATGNQKTKHATLYGHVVIHDTGGGGGPFGGFTPGGAQSSQGPSTLNCDKLDIDSARKFYTATGNVHYVQGNRTIDAEKGTLNDITKDLTLYTLHFTEGSQKVDASQGVMNGASHVMDLTGKVHIVDGGRKMDADHVTYNTQSGALHAVGNVTMQFPSGEEQAPATTPAKKKKKRLLPF